MSLAALPHLVGSTKDQADQVAIRGLGMVFIMVVEIPVVLLVIQLKWVRLSNLD